MRKLFLVLLIALVVTLSGCITTKPTVQYKNDIITLEEYTVSERGPRVGSPVTIDFFVQNNGDKTVEEVEVNFFDLSGFKLISLDCQEPVEKDKTKCLFKDIEPFDARSVSLTLKAPKLEITSPVSLTISFSVKYDYSGYRKADIPIIDDVTRKQPLTKFSQSSPSYGPVVLEFEAPVGRETVKDSTVVKEYWGVKGRPFELKMNFKHVGSIANVQPIKIEEGDVKLELIGLKKEKDLPCDFKTKDEKLVSERDVTVPGELVCYLKSTDFIQPELRASVSASFDYTYEFIKAETFNVKPSEYVE